MAQSRWPILASGLVAVSLALSAQEPAPAQLEPFRTEVNYIRVDMYPTADGKPIHRPLPEDVECWTKEVPQKIDRFEHVVVRGARSQEGRREPATSRNHAKPMQDIRARLFVLFLDTEHVEFGAARSMSRALSSRLNQMIGGDDLIAVMTPDMQARDLTFRRRTTAIEELIKSRVGAAGPQRHLSPDEKRSRTLPWDATTGEARTEGCGYRAGDDSAAPRGADARRAGAAGPIPSLRARGAEGRHRNQSSGWRFLARTHPAASRRTILRHPTPDREGSPSGRLGTAFPGRAGLRRRSAQKCEQERHFAQHAAQRVDGSSDILHQANAGNTTFYPIDPRGLVVFDENIAPVAGVGAE